MAGLQFSSRFILLVVSFSVVRSYSNLPPVFDMDMNQLTLRESTPVGSLVYTLQGHDPEGSEVRYGLLGTEHFSVDPESGDVTVIKELDRETEDTLKFFVTLEDSVSEIGTFGEVNNNFVKVAISVIVLDDNDNIPRFMNLPYEAEADEDVPIGTTVFSGILVTDPDSVGETLSVACNFDSNSDACDKFKVVTISASQSEFRGAIVTKELLNYDQNQIHQIEIYTTDGLFNSTSVVELRVQDIQDTPPIFSGSLSAVLVEDAPIGTLVMTFVARDGDKGAPREIRYSLLSNPFNFFTLDSVNGELRTGRPIDREILHDATGVISIAVKAQEVIGSGLVDDPNAVTSAIAFITVKDVNDSPPMFNRAEYSISIPENTPIGTPLPNLDMFVHDPDVGQNAVFTLRLQDVTGVFAVEPTQVSGSSSVSIRLAKGTLDYENPNQRKSIVLVIAEETQSSPKHSSTATLTVTITDTNDNQPKFDREDYSATISEDLAPGSYVTTITAADYDSGVFGKLGIVYQMYGSGMDLFKIDQKTGEITVADCPTPGISPCLDFEEKQKYYLTLKATDDNGNGLSSVVSLLINLIDANDNSPVCYPKTQNVILDEDSTEFSIPLFITAKDLDVTSDIKYKIYNEDMKDIFAVDSFTGEVKLYNSTAINLANIFENMNILQVEANDGIHSVICTVNFTIRDINNNAPIFINDYQEIDLLESVPIKTIVARIFANDSDAGRNAELIYSIQKGGLEDFSIDNIEGIVMVARKLDYDHRKTYDIEIIAKDFGSPSLTGTATLVVNVLNVNDKNPYFTPTIQSVEVLEDTPIGQIIYTLSAEDPDVNSTSALNFEISDPIIAVDNQGNPITSHENYKDLFSVDPETGAVRTMQKLRRESYAVLRITVIVTDVTAPVLQQGKGTLVVSIVSSNKHPPVFQVAKVHQNQSSSVQMLEEQPIGTILDTYTASDVDSSISRYAIIPPSLYFEINNITGTVRTKRRIDFEEIKSIDFTIIAYDDGIPPLNTSMRVMVTIVNINDNTPIFNQTTYTMEVIENSPPGTIIGEVFATDKDEGMFGDISYSLQGEPHDYFTINELSGVITVSNTTIIDRESYTDVKLTALASDNAPDAVRKTATATVLIKIHDVNDNAPIFEHHIYHGSVDENIAVSPPTAILQVSAKDPDAGLNGTIKYNIRSGNDDGKFRLDPYTGILYPAKSLLNHTGQFILIIEAKDMNGTGTTTASTTISVFVAGINVHRPVFVNPQLMNSTVQILENTALPGFLIMTVHATDEDFGENGRVTYHLKVSNQNVQETEQFMIDQITGELRIKQFIDRKNSSRYDLILVAKDQAKHLSHETLRTLTVVITGTNKYEPTFLVNYQFYLKENSELHARVGRVQAIDQDEEPHAVIYYYIILGNEDEFFRIDKNDGTIYANAVFDREEKELYALYVHASNDDNINVTKRMDLMNSNPIVDKSLTKVEIYITDENDNAPVFKKLVYYAGINSRAAPGDSVVQVLAVDPDQGPNGTLTYSLDAVRLHRSIPVSSDQVGPVSTSSSIGGALVPPPFSIGQDGRVTTAEHMLGYDQERFLLEVSAQEVAVPNRRATAVVHVWVYNPEQLVRVIFSQPADEIYARQEEILTELANITGRLVVVDDIRYHVDSIGNVRDNWSDMYLHIVDPTTLQIAQTSDVLHDIDEKYDQLTDYYAGYAVENIVPALREKEENTFGSALGAVIALSVMMFIGAVALLVVCCSLKKWKYTAPVYNTNGMGELIEKQSTESINTTENPLWMEQKLKLYEEQELTMQVFSDPEVLAPGKENVDILHIDNTYATINPLMRGTSLNASLDLNDDYATLSSSIFTPHRVLQEFTGGD